jgi:hypothetical protein
MMGETVNAAAIPVFSPNLGFFSDVLKVTKDVPTRDRPETAFLRK